MAGVGWGVPVEWLQSNWQMEHEGHPEGSPLQDQLQDVAEPPVPITMETSYTLCVSPLYDQPQAQPSGQIPPPPFSVAPGREGAWQCCGQGPA